MQLDTEDGDTFVPPAGVIASPGTEHTFPSDGQTTATDAETGDARESAEMTRDSDE